MRILVVEKDANGRRLLERMLRMEGHEVFSAESGEGVLARIGEVSPDVVLAGLFPALDAGSQPVGEINVCRCDEIAPVVFMTSAESRQELMEALAGDGDTEATFESMSARERLGVLENIQQLCGTLGRYKLNANMHGHDAAHAKVLSSKAVPAAPVLRAA